MSKSRKTSASNYLRPSSSASGRGRRPAASERARDDDLLESGALDQGSPQRHLGEVGKPAQLEEPHGSNWSIYSALHLTVWGVCGLGWGWEVAACSWDVRGRVRSAGLVLSVWRALRFGARAVVDRGFAASARVRRTMPCRSNPDCCGRFERNPCARS